MTLRSVSMGSAIGFLALLGPVPMASGAPAPAAGTAAVREVVLENFEVRPPVVRIRRGDRVVWRFRDGVSPHNVVSRGADRFRSSRAKRSGSHRVSFRRTGVYRYLCTIHPDMRGRVVVRR